MSNQLDQTAPMKLSPNNRCSTQFTTPRNPTDVASTITPPQPERPPNLNNPVINDNYDPNRDIPEFNFDDTTDDEGTYINPTPLAPTLTETVTLLQGKLQIQKAIIKRISTHIRKLEGVSDECFARSDNVSIEKQS